jgi:hypothetical protein
MNPWLESASLFGSLHFHLIAETIRELQSALMARGYYIDASERIWVDESRREILPDAAVVRWRDQQTAAAVAEFDLPLKVKAALVERRETSLEIFDAQDHRLVTGIEILSPTNKQTTKGRRLYLRKQRELQGARVNLVEIDLLRKGRHLAAVPAALLPSRETWDYLVSVQRGSSDDEFELYPISLRQPLPRIAIPLKEGDADIALNLQAVLTRVYEDTPFHIRVNYDRAPDPPLSDSDLAWARQCIARYREGLNPK